jgi:GT2 family glycosyltransferase
VSTNAPLTRYAVTAIIIAHDGARLLPALVKALKAQTHPIEQVVGVDTASRDRSGAVLAELIGQDAVFGMNRSTGFGGAVATALRHASRRRSGMTDPSLARGEWIWLLHDDCEPAHDALERLLQTASRDRTVAVVGPKVLDAQDRRTLREVGIAVDRAGRRVTGIDPGEIDQGQHDHKRAVMAVGSAGMLVRRDVWERLGGFDPNLKLFRDDLDFCWRVQGAGWRVHVATDAILYHWELAGRRRRDAQGGSVRAADRRNALYVLAVNLPLLTMLRVVAGCILGSLVRACYFLLTKQLDQSAAYALSVAGLFAHPIRLFKGRRRRAAGIAEGYYAVRIFILPARTLARLAEKIAALVSNGPPQASGGRHQATAEESDEDAQFVEQVSGVRRFIAHPGVQLFFGLLLVALIASRRLLGTSPLGGGALVPAWGGASALWSEYLAGFHAVSVGTSASAPPYLAVVALLSTALGGQAWLAVDVLLLGCVPLAGITAYAATRWIATATPVRVLLAASYALLPVATGAVAAGRLGTAVAFILLPLIAVSAGRMLTAVPRQARRAAWATGLLVGLAAAFAPLVWVLGVVFAVAALGVRRWFVTVTPVNAAIVVVTPFFLLFPWSLYLLSSPSAFLAEAGLATPGLTAHGLGATALFALSPGGPGVPPVWVTIGFALALLALILPVRRFPVVIGGWAVAVVGLLAAVLLSRVSVTPPAGGSPADGWPGVALALAALGLLVAAAPAADWLANIIQNDSRNLPSVTFSAYSRAQRGLAVVAFIGAATAPLLVAAYWLKDGVRGPVGAVSAPLLPAFVSASSTSGAQYRTLILRPDGAGLDYQVVRQGDPSLGQPELGISATAGAALSREVAALGAPDGADAGDPGLVLGSFGIRWVMLPAPVDPVLASRLDASLGLMALNSGPSYDLWQVTGPVGRVRVVAPSGATTVLSSGTVDMSGAAAPASGGTLVLAEPYGGWTAALNGHALQPVAAPVDGWAQGFVLPPGGGQLSITRNNLARPIALTLELIATLAVFVLALPGKRVDPVEEAETLTALRVAKTDAAGGRAARPAAPGHLRPGGSGQPAVSRVDRIGPARKHRKAAADEVPEDLTPAAPLGQDAETTEPAESADAPAAETVAATPWDMAGDWGGLAGAPAQRSSAPESPPWGTESPDIAQPQPQPQPLTNARGRDDSNWLDDLLRKNGVDQPSAADTAPPAPSPTHASAQWAADPLDTSRPLPEAGRQDGSAAFPSFSPPRESSRPESPAPASSAGSAPEARPPWEAEAERAPWESGPRAPAPATGTQPHYPWEGGPQDPATATGARPASRTGAQPVQRPDAGSAWRTDAKSAWGTGAMPAARTGAQPAARTGAQPAARTGAQPMFTPTGPQPTFTPTGPQPTFTPTGAQPGFSPTGEHPVSSSGTHPVQSSGAYPVQSSGAYPAQSSGAYPVQKAPWEPDDRVGEPDPGATLADEDAYPGDADARSAKPERHSHRGGKHGKPRHGRGSGNRSDSGGES